MDHPWKEFRIHPNKMDHSVWSYLPTYLSSCTYWFTLLSNTDMKIYTYRFFSSSSVISSQFVSQNQGKYKSANCDRNDLRPSDWRATKLVVPPHQPITNIAFAVNVYLTKVLMIIIGEAWVGFCNPQANSGPKKKVKFG